MQSSLTLQTPISGRTMRIARPSSCGRVVALRATGAVPRAVQLSCRRAQRQRQQQQQRLLARSAPEQAVTESATTASSESAATNGTTDASSSSTTPAEPAPLPEGKVEYIPPSDSEKFWTSFKLAFALPWRRFKKDSVLTFKLEGEISDQSRGRFDPGLSVPQICAALQKAALDPRIKGVAVEIGPVAAGWAKVQEIRRYMSYFRQSGKFTVAYMKIAGEKEYYLASAFEEIYAPPTASLSLRGFSVSGTFLRGVLDKVGVEPQVKRIGKYKSAGDQLLRSSMSEPQAEQLNAILEAIYEEFLTTVSEARGKTKEEVVAMLEEGIFDMKRFAEGGWVTALKYEDEIIDDLKVRTAGDGEKEKEKPLRKIDLRKYSSVSPTAFGLPSRKGGKKRIVVFRTAGAILGKASGASSSAITPEGVIPTLRALAKDKSVAAVVLRVDSPGGDALASDLMWREIRNLGAKKPVVASMGDVAASGGYYMSMGCKTIVAEPLTITGSIGVVTGKFNLAELYEKVGYSKTILSKGRYAELLADNRPFTDEELELFDRAAEHAYESFRNKAAESRGMSIETMQEVAQGRVWTGKAALERGLVDALGGVNRAVAIARQLAGIDDKEKVAITEMGSVKSSPLQLLSGGASAGPAAAALSLAAALTGSQLGPAALASTLVGGSETAAAAAGTVAGALGGAALAQLPLLMQLQSGRVSYLLTDVDTTSIGQSAFSGDASAAAPTSAAVSASGSFLSEGEDEEGLLARIQAWLQ